MNLRSHVGCSLVAWLVLGWSGPATGQTTFFVATNGNDALPGDRHCPFQTLARAVREAAYGDTVVIGPGTYREAIELTPRTAPRLEQSRRDAHRTNRLVLRAGSLANRPCITGSDEVPASALEPIRQAPRFDTNGHAVAMADLPAGAWAYRVHLPALAAAPPQQVFLTRNRLTAALRQTGWPAPIIPQPHARPFWGTLQLTLEEDSFAYAAPYLYLRFRAAPGPADRLAVSTRGWIWDSLRYPHVHLEGLDFEHANASAVRTRNAVQLGAHSLLTNCVVQWTDLDGVGLHLHSVAAHCWLNHNGRLGGTALTGSQFTDCLVTSNNYRNFMWDGCGGVKISNNAIDMSGLTVARCEFAFNRGPAFWVDSSIAAFEPLTFKNNYVHDNLPVLRWRHPCGHQQALGVFIEVSRNVLAFNNLIVNNLGGGFYLSGSSHCQVYHNTVVAPALTAIPGVCPGHKGFVPLVMFPRAAQCATNAATETMEVLAPAEANVILNNIFVSEFDARTGLSPVAAMTPNGCLAPPQPCHCVIRNGVPRPTDTSYIGGSAANVLDYNCYSSGPRLRAAAFFLYDPARATSRWPELCPNSLVPFERWQRPLDTASTRVDLRSIQAHPGFLPPRRSSTGCFLGVWTVPPGLRPTGSTAPAAGFPAARYLLARTGAAAGAGAVLSRISDPDFANDLRGVARHLNGRSRPDLGALTTTADDRIAWGSGP